jgi:hypothetical protein
MVKNNSENTRMPVAQAANLIDLIDYQEGSIVSRAVTDEKAGTVTAFAFDEGQGLNEHTAAYDALFNP